MVVRTGPVQRLNCVETGLRCFVCQASHDQLHLFKMHCALQTAVLTLDVVQSVLQEAQYNLEPYSDAQHHQPTSSGGSKYPSIHKTGETGRPAAKDDITSRLDQLELESLRR